MTRRGFLLAAASPTPASAGEYFLKGVTKNGIVGASLVLVPGEAVAVRSFLTEEHHSAWVLNRCHRLGDVEPGCHKGRLNQASVE